MPRLQPLIEQLAVSFFEGVGEPRYEAAEGAFNARQADVDVNVLLQPVAEVAARWLLPIRCWKVVAHVLGGCKRSKVGRA